MNTGCIPTKTLVRSAEVAHLVRSAQQFGVKAPHVAVDFPAVIARKNRIVGKILDRMGEGLAANTAVTLVRGHARFRSPHEVGVDGRLLSAPHVVIATGSRPAVPPIKGLDLVPYLTSDNIMDLAELPSRLVVLGAGAVGLEFAQMFARFGSKVTVFEMLDRILPGEDIEITTLLLDVLGAEGLDIHIGSKVTEVAEHRGVKLVTADTPEGPVVMEADAILVATGRAPNIEAMGLEEAGIEHTRKGVSVDPMLRTSVPGVWAAGDVTGHPMFTHAAVYASSIVVENAFAEGEYEFDPNEVPRATFVEPEVASIGLTEEQAVEQGFKVRVGRQPMANVGRARVMETMEGVIKFVVDAESGRILGTHILGQSAGELIHIANLARNAGEGNTDPFLQSIFIHPTLMEGVQSAVEAVWSDATPIMTH